MCETVLTSRPHRLYSPSMTSQTICVQRTASTSRQALYHPRSSRREGSPRPYGHGIETRYPLSLPLPAAAVQTTRILIVDDLGSSDLLVYLLHSLGCWATRSASSGVAAMRVAREFLPSIILINLQLPGMDAYQVAEQLRNQAGGRPTRIIALTTDSLHSARDLARQAGFERYLAKPVSVIDLLQLLRPQRP
jgi:CheY-like chemotaxis protein